MTTKPFECGECHEMTTITHWTLEGGKMFHKGVGGAAVMDLETIAEPSTVSVNEELLVDTPLGTEQPPQTVGDATVNTENAQVIPDRFQTVAYSGNVAPCGQINKSRKESVACQLPKGHELLEDARCGAEVNIWAGGETWTMRWDYVASKE